MATRGIPNTWSRPTVIAALVVVTFWFLTVLTVQWWAPYDPLDAVGERLQSPSWQHPLGTDALSRDVLTRVLYGARQTIPISVIVIVSAVLIGSALGAIAGFLGGGGGGRSPDPTRGEEPQRDQAAALHGATSSSKHETCPARGSPAP